MEVPVNSLHSQGYVSIGCEPCTRPVPPGQHEREGRWWWEDAKAKECGLNKVGSFPTILLFTKNGSRPIKYPSEKRDVDSLLAFINALR
ncbi:probable 5'-adenylylsulfate reductase 1, chloroplastic [Asparagus officinalis]|uniref:probable 5'-adenylylsulfate reductase 1, chloroplastic n=1 Tax=Asparagus officinalis TaxID=4686 RepID=UPI00098DEC4F|nr:probable 5'-adenylylsulfate reductase 1, chloroplastic [Asparagus officinalis]